MRMSDWARSQIVPFANGKVRDLAYRLSVGLAAATPKDTTHAASNWPVETEQRAQPVGSKKSVDWSAFRFGLAMLASYSVEQGRLFITNTVHYMRDLNERGSSPQAPVNFVDLTIRKIIQAFR